MIKTYHIRISGENCVDLPDDDSVGVVQLFSKYTTYNNNTHADALVDTDRDGLTMLRMKYSIDYIYCVTDHEEIHNSTC